MGETNVFIKKSSKVNLYEIIVNSLRKNGISSIYFHTLKIISSPIQKVGVFLKFENSVVENYRTRSELRQKKK